MYINFSSETHTQSGSQWVKVNKNVSHKFSTTRNSLCPSAFYYNYSGLTQTLIVVEFDDKYKIYKKYKGHNLTKWSV